MNRRSLHIRPKNPEASFLELVQSLAEIGHTGNGNVLDSPRRGLGYNWCHTDCSVLGNDHSRDIGSVSRPQDGAQIMRVCQAIQNQQQRILFLLCFFQNIRQICIGKLRYPQNKTLVNGSVRHLLQGFLGGPRDRDLLFCRQIFQLAHVFATQIILNVKFISRIGHQGLGHSMHAVNNIIFFHTNSISQAPPKNLSKS